MLIVLFLIDCIFDWTENLDLTGNELSILKFSKVHERFAEYSGSVH